MKRTRQLEVFKRRIDGARGRSALTPKIVTRVPALTCFDTLSLNFDHGLNDRMLSQPPAPVLKTEHCQLKTGSSLPKQIPSRKNAGKNVLREQEKSAGLPEQRLVSFG